MPAMVRKKISFRMRLQYTKRRKSEQNVVSLILKPPNVFLVYRQILLQAISEIKQAIDNIMRNG
jgi:hypothetical protein